MIPMSRVVHFEFGAQEPERAAQFYRDVFGWQIEKWDGGEQPYWLVTTGPDSEMGINGGILRHQDGAPRTVNTISVASVEDAIEKVTRAGGKLVVPKMAIPGMGWLAYCTDTEGLIFGLFLPDAAAA